jgi:hypothetical protein
MIIMLVNTVIVVAVQAMYLKNNIVNEKKWFFNSKLLVIKLMVKKIDNFRFLYTI